MGALWGEKGFHGPFREVNERCTHVPCLFLALRICLRCDTLGVSRE